MKLQKPLFVACVLFAYLFKNDSFFSILYTDGNIYYSGETMRSTGAMPSIR